MNIEFLMAARNRIIYQGQTTLIGALLDKKDNDRLVAALESAEQQYRGDPDRSALDAIEIAIAEEVDDGDNLPISNPEGFGAALWLAQADLATLPDPIPRSFVLYLAKAWADAGKFPNFTTALTEILNTRTFS